MTFFFFASCRFLKKKKNFSKQTPTTGSVSPCCSRNKPCTRPFVPPTGYRSSHGVDSSDPVAIKDIALPASSRSSVARRAPQLQRLATLVSRPDTVRIAYESQVFSREKSYSHVKTPQSLVRPSFLRCLPLDARVTAGKTRPAASALIVNTLPARVPQKNAEATTSPVSATRKQGLPGSLFGLQHGTFMSPRDGKKRQDI